MTTAEAKKARRERQKLKKKIMVQAEREVLQPKRRAGKQQNVVAAAALLAGLGALKGGVEFAGKSRKLRIGMGKPQGAVSSVNALVASDNNALERAHTQYFGGLVDPRFASRGPMDSNDPTVVATFQARTAMNIAANPGVAHSVYGANQAQTPQFFANTGNSIGICVTPYTFVNNTVAATNYSVEAALRSGFTFDPDAGFGNAPPNDPQGTPLANLFTAASTVAPVVYLQDTVRPWPLANFNSQFPGVPSTIEQSNRAVPCESWRMLGLRATISVESSAFTAAGTVICGDGETYHQLDPPTMQTILAAAGEQSGTIVPVTPTVNDAFFASPINDGTRDARLAEVGAFTHGCVYEATWLPTNNDAREYKDEVISITYTTANSPALQFPIAGNMGSMIANQGSLIFVLKDLVLPAAIIVNVTMSCEITIRVADSPIGFLMNQARFGRCFVPDWSRFAGVRPSGLLGYTKKQWCSTPAGRVSCMLESVGGDEGRVPVQQSAGAIPPEMISNGTYTNISSYGNVNAIGGLMGSYGQYSVPDPYYNIVKHGPDSSVGGIAQNPSGNIVVPYQPPVGGGYQPPSGEMDHGIRDPGYGPFARRRPRNRPVYYM
jgi:hypothetical protein